MVSGGYFYSVVKLIFGTSFIAEERIVSGEPSVLLGYFYIAVNFETPTIAEERMSSGAPSMLFHCFYVVNFGTRSIAEERMVSGAPSTRFTSSSGQEYLAWRACSARQANPYVMNHTV